MHRSFPIRLPLASARVRKNLLGQLLRLNETWRISDGKKQPQISHRDFVWTVPSQATIYDKMISDDNNFASTLVPKNKIAEFLDRGLKIQDSQRKLKHLIHDTEEHELQAWKKEISKRTSKLREQIAGFRRDQKNFMPKLGDKVAAQTA
ncbi:hypothetical protein B0H10DRAFT_1962257, partial [Mycena sp. CBHHK59/15]